MMNQNVAPNKRLKKIACKGELSIEGGGTPRHNAKGLGVGLFVGVNKGDS